MIKQARSSNSYALFKQHVTHTPEWSALLDLLNRSYDYKSGSNRSEKIISSRIFMRNPLDLLVMNVFGYPDAEINATNDSINYPLAHLMDRNWSGATASLNLVKDEFDKDVSIYHYDTVIWVCQGSYDFQIYNKLEDSLPNEQIELELGDLIFISRGLPHKLISKKPAAYIRYMYL